MSWIEPVTRTTGTLVTAAMWNQDVVANAVSLGNGHNHATNVGAGGGGALTFASFPSTCILPFDQACPTGWTRISAWDDKFLMGGSTYGATGGAATHYHVTDGHVHAMGFHTHAGPSHNHGMDHEHENVIVAPYEYGVGTIIVAGDNGAAGGMCLASGSGTSGQVGTADKVVTGRVTAAGGTGNTGAPSDNSTATSSETMQDASSLPPYIKVVWCKRN